MSNRLLAHRFDGRIRRSVPRRLRIVPGLVATICALLAIASVTVGQPKVDALQIIG
jgi:hypothetical protein